MVKQSLDIVFPFQANLKITKRNLPHWMLEGSIYWVTFRLSDSIPANKLAKWKNEYALWEKLNPKPWTNLQRQNYNEHFEKKIEKWLDAGEGRCYLRDASIRELVQKQILFFDRQRYQVIAFVIMPNHIHLLMRPVGEYNFANIMQRIKGSSARECNKLIGLTGKSFWQDESYDHIVRDEEQLRFYLQYIINNPIKAKLRKDEWTLYVCEEVGEILR